MIITVAGADLSDITAASAECCIVFGESAEYFLTVLKTCRPVFVKQCIEALARITDKEFKGDLSDIEAARKAALEQYSAPKQESAD